MAEAAVTISPGKTYGQEYAGRNLRIYDVSFSTLQTVTFEPANSANHQTPTAAADEPAIRVTGTDAGSSGGLTSGTSTFVSDGTTTGLLYVWHNGSITGGTATVTARTVGAQREQKLLGCKMRVFDFASVANTNTYTSNLTGIVDWCYQATTKPTKVTESAGVFTFTVTSGPATNVRLIVWHES